MERAGRRLLGRLQDERAARGERPGDLARRLAHREVPGREGRDHADRLVHHDIFDAGLARDDPSIGALALGRVPFEELAAADHLKLRLSEGLAMLEGDRMGDLVDAGAHQRRGLEHDLATGPRRGPAPNPEALPGRSQRVVEIGTSGDGDGADHALIGRVEHRQAVGGLAPGAADIELEVGIGGHEKPRTERPAARCRDMMAAAMTIWNSAYLSEFR